MVIVVVTFRLPQPATSAQMADVFRSTAPKYVGVAGLLKKHYWLSEDGLRAGGIYLWVARADAERLYTDEWKERVSAKYGARPEIAYLSSPVSVNNSTGVVETHQAL